MQTGKNGGFSFLAPSRRPSREVKLVYFPYSDGHQNIQTRRLFLGVRAGLAMSVDHPVVRNRQRVVFRGRLLGAVPADGVAVSLQAKVGRRYRTFRQLRTSGAARGRLRTAYRFTRTQRPVHYRFRFRVLRQSGLPYEAGASRVVSVLVRP